MSIKSLLKTAGWVVGCSFALMGCNDHVNLNVTKYPDYWTDPDYASSIAIGPVDNRVLDELAYSFFESYLVDEFRSGPLDIQDRTLEYQGYSVSEALNQELQSANPADLYLTSAVTEFKLDTDLVIIEEEREIYLLDDWGNYIYDEYGDPIVMIEIIELERYEHTGTAELSYTVYDVDTQKEVTNKVVRRSWTYPEYTIKPNDFNFDYILGKAADEVIYAVTDQNVPYSKTLLVQRNTTLSVASEYTQEQEGGILCDRYTTDKTIELLQEPHVYLVVDLPDDAANNPFHVDIIQKTDNDEINQSPSTQTFFSQSFLWQTNPCGYMVTGIETKQLYEQATPTEGDLEFYARLWAGDTLVHSFKFRILNL